MVRVMTVVTVDGDGYLDGDDGSRWIINLI